MIRGRPISGRSALVLGLAFTVMAGAAALFLTDWAPRLATPWLLTGEPPRPADLMVVLSGASTERSRTALDLWRRGMAPRIVITGLGPDDDRRFLEREGVPGEALLQPPLPSNSTYEDAISIRRLVREAGVESILIVTSPYHCRRAHLIFSRVLSGTNVTITVTPSVSLHMDPDHWWQSRQGWITAGLEFPKLIWAWATVTAVAEVGPDSPSK